MNAKILQVNQRVVFLCLLCREMHRCFRLVEHLRGQNFIPLRKALSRTTELKLRTIKFIFKHLHLYVQECWEGMPTIVCLFVVFLNMLLPLTWTRPIWPFSGGQISFSLNSVIYAQRNKHVKKPNRWFKPSSTTIRRSSRPMRAKAVELPQSQREVE